MIMKVGVVIEDIWDFFYEVNAELNAHHQTSLFERRTNKIPILNARIARYQLHRDLRSFMQENDVLFFEWASELLAIATHFPKICGIVVRMHRYDMYEWIDKVNWEAVDKIILVSQAKRDEFTNRYPGQASKIVVIPEAISLEKFQFRPKRFNGDIGILCHISPRKRVYDLILDYYELLRIDSNFHLHIGGNKRPRYSDYYEVIRALVKKLDIESKVTFYGNVEKPQDWYPKIDIFISNSYSEGLQVAPIEALASGCYVLSHRWDGAEELLPEENLFITSRELIEKILCYCKYNEDEKLRQRERLRSIAEENFNISKVKVSIRQIVEEVGLLQKSI